MQYGRIKVPTTWDAHTQEQPDDNRLIRAEQRSALPLYDSAGSAAAGGRGVALLARMVSSGIFQHSMSLNSSRLTLPSLLGSAMRIISSHSACVRASSPPALVM